MGTHGLRVPEEALAEGAQGSPRAAAGARLEALAEARLRGRTALGTLEASPALVQHLVHLALVVERARLEVGADGLTVSEVDAAAEVARAIRHLPGRGPATPARVARPGSYSARATTRESRLEGAVLFGFTEGYGRVVGDPGCGGTHPASEKGGAGLDWRRRQGPRALARSLA